MTADEANTSDDALQPARDPHHNSAPQPAYDAEHPDVPEYTAPAHHADVPHTPTTRALNTATKPITALVMQYSTETAIYGTVLVSALIGVGWEFNTDLEVLLFVVGTVGVFWIAHLYAGAVTRPLSDGPRGPAIRHAIAESAKHSGGLLTAMLLPAIALFLATIGVIDEYVAYYIALSFGVVILAVLGWVNSARRKSPWYLRLASAAITAALGVFIIWLSALVH